jgi:acetoin utilization protein AcuB
VHVDVLMSRDLVVVAMDDSLATIKKLFDQHGFHHLLVVENSELCGIISDRDVFKALSPKLGTAAESDQDLASLNKRAHQIMSRKLITLTLGSGVHAAIDVFNQHKISCIPIVDENNVPVGIISWRDIMRVIGQNRASKS